MKKILSLVLTAMLLAAAWMVPAMADGDRFAFDRSVTSLFVGDTLTLSLERAGNAAQGNVSYKSSARQNASVDENGVVTGLKKGSTTITATLSNAGRTFEARINLEIKQRVEKVGLNGEKVALHDGAEADIAPLLKEATTLPVLVLPLGETLTAPIVSEPLTANNRRLTLTSSDESVLKVQGYNLTPMKAGECELRLASVQNPEVTASYHVLVVTPVRRVQVSADPATLWVGETAQANAAILPEDATIKQVTWRSSNEKVATVDDNGVITGIGRGVAEINGKAADGSGRNANVSVRVKQQPTGITLSTDALPVNMAQYQTLRATILPQNADSKNVTWESDNENVAKVNASGRVTPVSVGTCTITCRSADFSAVAATCQVTVNQLVEKVAFAAKNVNVNVGSTCILFLEISPINATNTAVTFRSTNEKVATVDANGTVYGLKRGECSIVATAADGSGRRGSVKVKVIQPVTGVHMYNDTIRVGVRESTTARAVMEPENANNTNMTWQSADTTIATVKGSKNRPTVTGKRWGETTITGVTEDGGYTTTATVKVGNYDKALSITDLYLQNNKIKINVRNDSNMNITRFKFTIECFDVYDAPLAVTESGSNVINGTYRLTLSEGDTTQHGRFGFGDYVQPEAEIGRVVMKITSYRTDEGYSRNIKESKRPTVEYKNASWVGPVK